MQSEANAIATKDKKAANTNTVILSAIQNVRPTPLPASVQECSLGPILQ
jgi:hypothetical protein